MLIAFQIIVLSFIRDWYEVAAMNSSGPLRHEFKERSKTVQKAIDAVNANGGDD